MGYIGTSLVVQLLRICISKAGDTGLIPGRGTKISYAVRQLNLQASVKTQHSQNNNNKKE